jgi:branched-chain amino acid transport system permease protein
VLLGGVGTIVGPAVGAVVYLVFEEFVWRNLLQFPSGTLGIIIVALVLFMPNGIVAMIRRVNRSRAP